MNRLLLDGRITILTRPPEPRSWRHWVKWLHERKKGVPWEGHQSLTVNTAKGLRAMKQKFSLNPIVLPRDTTAILTVWAPHTVEWVCQRRLDPHQPRFVHALAPTAVTTVLENFPQLAAHSPGIDLVFPASDFQHKRFRDCDVGSAFSSKFRVWPAGVDTDWWNPGRSDEEIRKGHLLIYHKRCPDGVLDMVRRRANQSNWKVREVHYGKYTMNEFRSRLQECELAVFLSDWESQGIALAEAWACNVPTLAWTRLVRHPLKYTAPYLSESTGHFFEAEDDLSHLLSGGWKTSALQPREWTVANMSILRSAEILVDHLRSRLDSRVNTQAAEPAGDLP